MVNAVVTAHFAVSIPSVSTPVSVQQPKHTSPVAVTEGNFFWPGRQSQLSFFEQLPRAVGHFSLHAASPSPPQQTSQLPPSAFRASAFSNLSSAQMQFCSCDWHDPDPLSGHVGHAFESVGSRLQHAQQAADVPLPELVANSSFAEPAGQWHSSRVQLPPAAAVHSIVSPGASVVVVAGQAEMASPSAAVSLQQR